MIKLVIFDLDGVLVDSRELHYIALNKALELVDPKYVIHREEHLSKYDGLTTTKKLEKLTVEKGLPSDEHHLVWVTKQVMTVAAINDVFRHDKQKRKLLFDLSGEYKVAVASNSIHNSVKAILYRTGLAEYVDRFYSNEDVRKPKPASDIYMKAMVDFGVSPKETLIIEDSHIGREAALNSGAHLLAVRSPEEVTYERVHGFIDALETDKLPPKWQGGKMNVLIPMAGAGSRFEKAGYTFPKPLIEVHGKPMIQLVVDNININARHIFIVQKSHYEKYNLRQLLNLIAPGCEIVQVEGVTEGAACTTLLAKEFINNNEPLVIANSDQYVQWNSNEFMYSMIADTVDGGILTFTATHPKWSFAKLNDMGFVSEVAEKNPISNVATVGIYFWRQGSDYVKYAEQMIENDIRVNNEFYVCPVFNEAIGDGKKIKTFHIEKMWGIGTPEDLQIFLQENEGDR